MPERTEETVGEALSALLAARGLSLRAFAGEAGVSQAHFSRLIKGEKTASADLARRLALALRLSEHFFPEYREALVIEPVRADAKRRERLYRRQ